jgi:hypothetical protein
MQGENGHLGPNAKPKLETIADSFIHVYQSALVLVQAGNHTLVFARPGRDAQAGPVHLATMGMAAEH